MCKDLYIFMYVYHATIFGYAIVAYLYITLLFCSMIACYGLLSFSVIVFYAIVRFYCIFCLFINHASILQPDYILLSVGGENAHTGIIYQRYSYDRVLICMLIMLSSFSAPSESYVSLMLRV
jgi:hypothetical protein